MGSEVAGRYRLTRHLGGGGMGEVWAAERTTGGELVAIKFVRDDARTPEVKRRFEREARALATLAHPNVIRIEEIVEDDGWPVLVMPLLDGRTLEQELDEKLSLPLAHVGRIFEQVTSAVMHAHAAGIVHRDLKPANIFLCKPPSGADPGTFDVRVLDFGIAKVTAGGVDTTNLTQTGAVMGTPCFMSPEQVFGEADVDARTDVWAIGMMLYQALCGVLPTKADNIGKVMKVIVTRQIFPLAELAPDLPADITAMVGKMLAPKPEDRPSDLTTVHEILARYAEGKVESQPPQRRAQRAIDPESDTLPVQQLSPRAMSVAAPVIAPPRRRRRFFALAALAIALGGSVAAWALATKAPPHDTSTPPHSPLDDPQAVLACPLFEASGVDAPTGWLGAAAADLACRRATWLLGGREERTRTPAELLSLPREPVDDFPIDPYAAADARDKSIAAARATSAAYLDGSVDKHDDEISLTLRMRRNDTTLIASGAGRGNQLHEAIARALDDLAAHGALPPPARVDPEVTRWLFVDDVNAGLSLDDIQGVSGTDPQAVAEPCRALRARNVAAIAWLIGDQCSWPDATPVATDRSSPAAIALTAGADPDDRGAGAEVTKLLDAETSPLGRAQLAKARARIFENHSELDPAQGTLLAALRGRPRDLEIWDDLVVLRSVIPAKLARVAWGPSSARAWRWLGTAIDKDDAKAIVFLERALALGARESDNAVSLGRRLIQAGRPERARAVVARYTTGDAEDRLAAAYILAKIDMSEARLGGALDRLRAALLDLPEFGSSNSYLAALSAWHLSRLLGRAEPTSEALVRHFLLDAQPRLAFLVESFSEAAVPVIALCMTLPHSLADTAFATLERLLEAHRVKLSFRAAAFLEGAKRYAAKDSAGAVRAWRKLGDRLVTLPLPVEALDAAGEAELAKAHDAAALDDKLYHGASDAIPREAMRAEKRGEHARAKELAQKAVDAWSGADVDVPSLKAMRQILGR